MKACYRWFFFFKQKTAYEMRISDWSSDVCSSDLIATMPPDGALLPETYHFHRGDSREDVLERMQQSMDAVLAELWQARQEDLPLDSAEEVLTLASIIEKETGVDSARALVASVFVNRMRKGMPLQSDPTVVYGLTEGKAQLDRALTRKDLDR